MKFRWGLLLVIGLIWLTSCQKTPTATNRPEAVEVKPIFVNNDLAAALAPIRQKILASEAVSILAGPSDSITEGAGLADYQRSWTRQLFHTIASKHYQASAEYFDLVNEEGATNFPVKFSGPFTAIKDAGLGNQSVQLAAKSTMEIQLPTQANAVILHLEPNSTGTFETSLDGENWQPQTSKSRTLTIPISDSATLLIRHLSGAIKYNGYQLQYGSGTAQFQLSEAGHNGAFIEEYLTNQKWLAEVTQLAPNLVILPIGSNNYVTGTPVTKFKQDLLKLIKRIRKSTPTPPTILLLGYYDRAQSAAVNTWDEYRLIYSEIANADPAIGYLDLTQEFGQYDATDRGGLVNSNPNDLTHPSAAGHQAIASKLASLLVTPPAKSQVLLENLATNPSFQLNQEGWIIPSANSGISFAAVTQWQGNRALQVAQPPEQIIAKYPFTFPKPGSYTIGIDIATVGNESANLLLSGYDDLRQPEFADKAVTAKPTRLVSKFVVGQDLTGEIVIRAGTSSPGPWIIDGLSIVAGNHGGSYFDGDSKNTDKYSYQWAGLIQQSKTLAFATPE